MGKTLFVGDTHFGEEAIILYENRPFQNTKEMDEVLIKNWNSEVNPEDIVYVVGDFGANGREKEYLSRLNGIKYLIKGNHDTKSNEYYRAAGFKEVYDKPIVLENFWIISHEPLYMNVNMPYANIFAHVHNSPLFKDFSACHFCASAERINFTPILFDDIKVLVLSGVSKSLSKGDIKNVKNI